MKEITNGPYKCSISNDGKYNFVIGDDQYIVDGWESLEPRRIDLGAIRVIEGKLSYCCLSEQTIESRYRLFGKKEFRTVWAPYNIFPK